ncbi:uncharacterized protein LOC116932070 [Daphnia magna]|uniref:uncharacterized protein LOC116932070 n=1 Tax=Daphnia magna TaxID=35525 RepID=UPI001E1BC2D8|nr:uncharacterized protein LOC116932070 [Daphnia magna]
MKANTVIILLVPILLAIHFAEATASYGTSAGYVLTTHTESDEYHGRLGDDDDDEKDRDDDEDIKYKKLNSGHTGVSHVAQVYTAPAYVAPVHAAPVYSAPHAVPSSYGAPAYEASSHNTEAPYLPYWLRSG